MTSEVRRFHQKKLKGPSLYQESDLSQLFTFRGIAETQPPFIAFHSSCTAKDVTPTAIVGLKVLEVHTLSAIGN